MLIATSPCANALGTADPVPVFNCITLGMLFLLLYKYVSYQKVPPFIIPVIVPLALISPEAVTGPFNEINLGSE